MPKLTLSTTSQLPALSVSFVTVINCSQSVRFKHFDHAVRAHFRMSFVVSDSDDNQEPLHVPWIIFPYQVIHTYFSSNITAMNLNPKATWWRWVKW